MYKTAPPTEGHKVNVTIRLPLEIREKLFQKAHGEMYRSLSAYLETVIIRHSTHEDFAAQLAARMDAAAGNIAEKVGELAAQSQAIKAAPALLTESVLDTLEVSPADQSTITQAITQGLPNRRAIVSETLAPIFAEHYPIEERETDPEELTQLSEKVAELESHVQLFRDDYEFFENKYSTELFKKFKGKVFEVEGEEIEVGTLAGLYLVLSYKFLQTNQ